MPAGLLIRNDNNILQIDETNPNFMLREKRSVALTGNGVVTQYTFTYTGSPLACFATTVSPLQGPSPASRADFAVAKTNYVDGVWNIVCTGNRPSALGAVNGELYIFDTGFNPTVDPTFGLAVYDANGKIAYHSSQIPLRIVPLGLAANRKCVAIQQKIGLQTITTPNQQGFYARWAWMMRLNNQAEEGQLWVTPVAQAVGNQRVVGSAIYADVTEFG